MRRSSQRRDQDNRAARRKHRYRKISSIAVGTDLVNVCTYGSGLYGYHRHEWLNVAGRCTRARSTSTLPRIARPKLQQPDRGVHEHEESASIPMIHSPMKWDSSGTATRRRCHMHRQSTKPQTLGEDARSKEDSEAQGLAFETSYVERRTDTRGLTLSA